jgi:hypothetical protein
VVRYVFLHPDAPKLFDDWDEQIRACVGRLRAIAGVEPNAADLTGLVDELLAKSPQFADLWERYDVRWHTHGSKTFHHPDVGDLTPGYQSMQVEGTPGHRFIAYFAEPGTADHDKLVLLDLAAPEQEAAPAPPASQAG